MGRPNKRRADYIVELTANPSQRHKPTHTKNEPVRIGDLIKKKSVMTLRYGSSRRYGTKASQKKVQLIL